ncbi:MAG TPA: hypothetical protein PLP39_08970 [Flavobacterium lutivivi]|nr:hypothetical protein [Flavobacterium lutivivi]
MSRIRTIKQLTSKLTAVTANAYDAIIETVALTDASDTEFQFVVNNSVIQNISTILISTEYPSLTGNSSRVVTLTGTSGTANITVGGVDYLATFTTNLTTSANNFVTSHSAALLALGITVTANSGALTFVAATETFPTIARTNVSGDLSATIASVTAVATTGSPIVDLVSYVRGAMTVRVRNYGTAALNNFVRFHFKITHN